MSDIDIYGVETNQLDTAWDDISPFIQSGLDYAQNELSLNDVYHGIKKHQIVPIVMSYQGEILSVVTMEISNKPQKRIMCLMTAGGTELDSWLDEFMSVAEHLAIEQGCDAIYINGRRGWERKLKRYGYSQAYTVLMRQLQ